MSDFLEPYKPYLKAEAAASGGIPGSGAAPAAPTPAAQAYTDYDAAATAAASTPAPATPAPDGSTDFDTAAREAGAAYSRNRVELMDSFSFMTPVSDAQYRVISQNLAQIAEEGGDVAGTAYKWAAAIEYGRYFQRPAEDIMRDFDTFHMAWMGQPFGAKPSDLRAIKDSFVVGSLSVDLGKLAMQWKNSGGTDTEIEKQLDALRGQMDQLQDSYPRSWFVEALKAGANAAPYIVQVTGKGAVAAMAGAGVVAAAGATGATLGGTSPAVVAAAIGAARAAASFQESMQMMEGLAYYDMRKRGIRHDIAAPMAFVSGGVQAVIESSLGNIAKLVGPSGKLAPAAATNATSRIMKYLVASGKLGMIGTALASYGAEAVEEGTEELLQSLADAVIQEGAASLEGDGIERKTAQEIMANAWQEFKGGFQASLLIGIPGTAIGYKGDVQQARTLSAFAGTVDKDDFIFKAKDLDLPMFEGLTAKDKADALGRIWESQQARKGKETTAEAARVPEADVEILPGDEDAEPGSIPVRKTAEGTIRTQLGEVRDRPDGSTEAIVKAGSPDSPDRYGYARYTVDGDTVRISEVMTRAGVTDETEVRRALVLEVAAQNPGLAVEWDTKSEKNQEVRDRIIRENPRGADAGLQWYAAEDKPADSRSRNEFRAKILSSFRNVTTDQADVITTLSERRAARVGLSLEAYRAKFIQGITTETPEGVLAAQKAGKRILGATVIRDGKALIYAAQNADFSTLAHEFMHVWENEARETGGEDLARLEKAFGIEPGKWTDEARERVAYSWEEFLRSGKAETPELKTIFQRIASWMKDIYRKFMGKVVVTPEIREAFETLFKDPESPLSTDQADESAGSTQEGRQGVREASDGKTYGKEGGPAFALAHGADPVNLAAGTEGRNLLQEDFSSVGAEVSAAITRDFTGIKPTQPVETLDQTYALVEAAHPDLVAFGEEYRSKFGGDLHHRSGLKKRDQALRKVEEGDAPNAILDIDGSTLLVPSEALAQVAAALDSDDRVVRIKNRISSPGMDGYRDILANVRLPNGAIAEFLIMTPQMLEAKKSVGHSFYEIFREYLKAQNEGKVNAQKAMDALLVAQRKLYDTAWTASLDAEASFKADSLDMRVEWNRIEAESPTDLLSVLSDKTRKTFRSLSTAYGAQVESVSTKVSEGSSKEGIGTSLISTSSKSIPQLGDGRKGGGVLFQSEDALRGEARTFGTWREFMEFVEATDSQENTDVEAMKEGEKERWYRDFWEEANRAKIEPLSPETADARFRSIVESKDGLDEFLGEIYNVMTETFDEPPQDLEEQAEYERRLALQKKLKAMHPTVQNNAVRIGLGRPLTDRARAAIETLMSSGATYYRRLYAQVMNDQDLSNVDKEAEKQALPNIEDPRLGDDSGLSIVERMKLLRSIQNEELRKRLAAGDIVPERDMVAMIEEAEKEKAALQKELAAKQAEIDEDYRMFTSHERTFSEQRERIRGLEEEAASAQKKIDRLIERGKSVSEALSSARQEAALQADAIRKQLAGMRQTERTKAREAKQKAIEDIRERMKAAEQKRRDAKKIIDYKKSIANKIMERPSLAIAYNRRIQIEALQKTLDPHFRRAKLKWQGEMLYIEDLLRNTQFLQDSALEAKLLARLEKKPLNEWTVAELEELLAQIQELTKFGRQEWAAELQARNAAGIRSATAITQEALKSGEYQKAAPAGSAERRDQLKKKNNLWKQVQFRTLNLARVANMLDFGKEGENTRLLVKESNRAYVQKMNNLDRRAEPIIKALKAAGYKGDSVAELARGLWERKYTIAGVGPEKTSATFTADDLMYISIALKDDHTRAAILYGNLATEQERLYQDKDIMASWARDKASILEKFIKENLTDADRAIIQAVENDYRDEFGRLNALFIEEFNVAMKQVGMYVPMFRESTASMDMAHEKQQAEEVLNVGGISIKRNPEKGFTHDRVNIAAKHQRAVQLGLISTWLKATEREEHFHAYTPYVRQLNRVYKANSTFSRGVRDAIVNTQGTEAMKYVENFINEVANPRSNTDDMNRIVRGLRGDLGAAYLGWKLSGVVKQLVTSPMPYLGYVSALDMTKSAFEYTAKHQEIDEFIRTRSAYMRHRVQNPIFQAMKDAAADPKVKQLLGGIKAAGMKGLEWADWTSVAIGWKAVYDKAIAEGKTDAEATEYADEVTQKCQPSARPEDLAPLFKTGSEFTRAFTQFQTALNVIWNQVSYDIPVAIKNKQYRFAIKQVSSYVLAGILLGMVTRGKEDDDETKLDDFFFWSLTQFTDSVPLIGSQVTSLWRQTVTGQKDTPYSSPLMPAIDELFSGAKDLTEGDWAGSAKNFSQGIGLFLGLPASGTKELIRTVNEGPGALLGRRKE